MTVGFVFVTVLKKNTKKDNQWEGTECGSWGGGKLGCGTDKKGEVKQEMGGGEVDQPNFHLIIVQSC